MAFYIISSLNLCHLNSFINEVKVEIIIGAKGEPVKVIKTPEREQEKGAADKNGVTKEADE